MTSTTFALASGWRNIADVVAVSHRALIGRSANPVEVVGCRRPLSGAQSACVPAGQALSSRHDRRVQADVASSSREPARWITAPRILRRPTMSKGNKVRKKEVRKPKQDKKGAKK